MIVFSKRDVKTEKRDNLKNSSRFLLHVSDFHINGRNGKTIALNALYYLTKVLKEKNVKVEYIMHSGDVIDSSDLYDLVASKLKLPEQYYISKNQEKPIFDVNEFNRLASKNEKEIFNKKLDSLVEKRFKIAETVFRVFASRLNVPMGNVVICCGNHDITKYLYAEEEEVTCESIDGKRVYKCYEASNNEYNHFNKFLDKLETANSMLRNNAVLPVSYVDIDNLSVLVMNTNWKIPAAFKQNYYCVNCELVRERIRQAPGHNEKKQLRIVLAHKPVYEICEAARLSYRRYIKTGFMADLQDFIGEKGIYLCGDKHTRSIVGSLIHDIPHYIGGEPLVKESSKEKTDVEYNLIEILDESIGVERKVHLTILDKDNFECELRPQDSVVSKLYDYSKVSVTNKTREILGIKRNGHSWENVCQEIYSWKSDRLEKWLLTIDQLFKSICKYREFGTNDKVWDGAGTQDNIFVFVKQQIVNHIKYQRNDGSFNVLNLRGEYSAGKSTFLGLLYVYLLHEYSLGRIDFIPVYFNLENDNIQDRIHKDGYSLHDAVKQVFKSFASNNQSIAEKEQQPICYIIDGLDEQDCWSYSSEDSVGRVLLDILAKNRGNYHIMSFSQHRLPCFKNTMPPRTYNDQSDIMYFNPIDVQEEESEDKRYSIFISSFLNLKLFPNCYLGSQVKSVSEIIRKFRRLTINPGFMNNNLSFLTSEDNLGNNAVEKNVDDIYRYYIDSIYEKCLNSLGYGFIHYAPIMAYLFSYCGYTYERFVRIEEDPELKEVSIFRDICNNKEYIYDAFQFIKKNNDAREYLVALHYNKELRYYAENPEKEIYNQSILNEFMSRNIAILIRKLWSDSNKFVIVCEKLLQRKRINNCMLSMLIYILAHQEMFTPLRQNLRMKMYDIGESIVQEQLKHYDSKMEKPWRVYGNNEFEKLNYFLGLSLMHSMKVFDLSSIRATVRMFMTDIDFCHYNRQHQMLYYGDLSSRGEEKRNPLNPGVDIVYKGFDFHNCYCSLIVKLQSDEEYPLRVFDMCTLWDLVKSRLLIQKSGVRNGGSQFTTFFYRVENKERADKVLVQLKTVFDIFLKRSRRELDDDTSQFFSSVIVYLERFIELRQNKRFEEIRKEDYLAILESSQS